MLTPLKHERTQKYVVFNLGLHPKALNGFLNSENEKDAGIKISVNEVMLCLTVCWLSFSPCPLMLCRACYSSLKVKYMWKSGDEHCFCLTVNVP